LVELVETRRVGLRMDAAVASHNHVARSRQARPAIGTVPPVVSTGNRYRPARASRRAPGTRPVVGRACRDPAGGPADAAVASHNHVARSRQARPAIGTVPPVVSTGDRYCAARASRRSPGTRPVVGLSLSRPGGWACGCRGSVPQSRREVSTGSTGDRYRPARVARPAIGTVPPAWLDRRSVPSRPRGSTVAGNALRRWSSLSRPGGWAGGCRGSVPQSRREVSTGSTGDRYRPARVARPAIGTVPPAVSRRSPGTRPVVGRACRDPAGGPADAAVASHNHVARSRQARPAIGTVPPVVSTGSTGDRYRPARGVDRPAIGTVSPGCLDRLDRRSYRPRGPTSRYPRLTD
jgi:hypothetical protein